ncbi:MAG: hypothetical protein KDI02_21275 [Anaerolineae bacterium]|nr:hypothetical protein [Anaerolineae bacterium]
MRHELAEVSTGGVLRPVGFGPITRRWIGRQVRLSGSTLLLGTALFSLFVALLALIQFSTPNLAGNDGYYHIKLAQVMRQEGLRPPFPWLPLTVLAADRYVDHHWLYHVLLMPFTWGDLRLGAKLASVILPALTFLTGWVLLRGQRVPLAALWSLGFLAVSEAFLYRMSMPRAQAASLLFLLLALHLTLTGRHRWLLVVGLLYVWLYNAFPLLLLVVGANVVARWLIDGRLALKPLLYASAGLGLGLVLNPYFPDNLSFIYYHLAPKLTEVTATSVGREWYPYQTWTLVENSGPSLVVFMLAVLALGLTGRRMGSATATLFFLAVLFGAMLFKSRRFVEYYPAFALLFCALAWQPLFEQWLAKKSLATRSLPVGLALLLAVAIGLNLQSAQESLQRSKSYQQYAGAATWLAAHTPTGSRVFQTDWDDFTRLFFYNTHNTYILGLDPTYMQSRDPDLYETWVDLTQGRIDRPSQTIVEDFGATYAVTDLDHTKFIKQAEADPHLREVYRDEDAAIFQVVDASTANLIHP